LGRAALRREDLDDNCIVPSVREVEPGGCPVWKDIAERNLTYRGYKPQWNSVVSRDGMLERYWKSVDRKSRTDEVVVPWGKVKEMLEGFHGSYSGGHVNVSKTVEKV
jgi:hypothetical protein